MKGDKINMSNWQREEEHKRYGDLLDRAREAKDQEIRNTQKAIDNIIAWAEQSEKERDERWKEKSAYRNDLIEKAKKRLNRDYRI